MKKEKKNSYQKQNLKKSFIQKKRKRQEKKTEIPKELENYPTIEEEYKLLKENNEYFQNIKDQKLENLLTDKNYIFGNYSNFYYNRYLDNFKENIQSQISSTWFKDKVCLDIGCNIGTLTMRIAQEFKPKMIIGIDIDSVFFMYFDSNISNINTGKVIAVNVINVGFIVHGPKSNFPFKGK